MSFPTRSSNSLSLDRASMLLQRSNVQTRGFAWPSNWKSGLQTERLSWRAKEALLSGGTCFDFVEYDDLKIQAYLSENRQDNIILFGPPKSDTETLSSATCFTRSQMQSQMKDVTAITVPCLKENHLNSADKRTKFYRVDLGFPAFVPEDDVKAMLASKHVQLFQALPTDLNLQFTASLEAAERKDEIYAGDHHCQAGTAKLVYRLYAIEFDPEPSAVANNVATKKRSSQSMIVDDEEKQRNSNVISNNNPSKKRRRIEEDPPIPLTRSKRGDSNESNNTNKHQRR